MSDCPFTTNPPALAADRVDWATLLVRAQDGDGGAYTQFLKSIAPYIRQVGHSVGLSPQDVEDGVQEVLITIHGVRHTYDPARPIAPWLKAIARNRLIDRVRRVGRTSGRETEFTEIHETSVPDATNSPDREGDARRLHAAIQELPPGQRQAIEMVKLKEMSLRDAAAATGQSETSLKVSVHRAIKRLRSIMGPEAP